ncbi:putative RNA-directed DNA polymerase from mobile element jockey-like [Apostichopus japonicus]|uniref:Putative RNA-directed DNA polymerase from mobile element jockey-like n=1 Tax=Stichopus japonicus TaxID=307972 RepID=A0A2G8KTE5_STIJA|nr:putative RNA-directed DNA polymerase from mobile element jockey-like [Apostichopus japonicus]
MSDILPITQTAYTSGRCTAELVFAFKVLAEKAITSTGYTINLLMLDMRKAFDTMQRGSLLTDLEQVLDNDELHLISLLIDNVSYTVKLEGKLGLPFNTNIGSPQGDSASAPFFITYLANVLKSVDNDIDAVILPSQLVDHDYSTTTTNSFFTVDQQYADDISWASNGQHILQDIEKRVSEKLAGRNLKINCTKTEKFLNHKKRK